MFEDLVNIYDDFTKNERTQSLARLAEENNLSFEKRSSFANQSIDIRGLHLFKGKGVKRFLGIISMPFSLELQGEIRFYDFVKTKDLETKTTSVVEIYCTNHHTKYFRLKPRTSFRKAFNFLPARSTDHRFKQKYKTENADIISDQQMQMLEKYPKLSVEGDENVYIFYLKNKTLGLLDIFPLIDFAEEFISEFGGSHQDDLV